MVKDRCKVAILDNCEIETLYLLNRERVPVEKTLESYDYILIPGWVWTEVCDSEFRKNYVKSLAEKGFPIAVLSEDRYIEIVEEELTLLKIFDMAISIYGQVKGYFQREIIKGKERVEIEYLYEEWIRKVYDEWPLKGGEITRSDGSIREGRKNAGEISIAFLAWLLKYQKKQTVDITIWTHDCDCRCCVKEIENRLNKDEKIILQEKGSPSYKSVDIILKELIERKIVKDQEVDKLINKVRQERRITYILKKEDYSNNLQEENVDNKKLKELLYNDKIDILW